MARSAFDEWTVGTRVPQMIYGGVDIHEVVARQTALSPVRIAANPITSRDSEHGLFNSTRAAAQYS
jgi:hypothetical protein